MNRRVAVGHRLNAEVRIVVSRVLYVVQAHDATELSYHSLLHEIPMLSMECARHRPP